MKGFFTIYGGGGHLGHVTSIMSSDFHSLYMKAFIKKMVQIGTVVSEKIRFEFLYVHVLGPRSRNDLDLQYLHIFIHSIRCLLLLICRSLAAIVSEKSTVFTFYDPNIEEVCEAYWFGPSVRLSVRLCVTLALGQEPLEIGS